MAIPKKGITKKHQNSFWQQANKFLDERLDRKKFQDDLVKYIKDQKFSDDETAYFGMQLKEAIGLDVTMAKLTYKK